MPKRTPATQGAVEDPQARCLASMPELERTCLTALVLFGDEMSRSMLVRWLQDLGVQRKPAPGKRKPRPLDLAALRPILRRWAKAGLVVIHGANHYERITVTTEGLLAILESAEQRALAESLAAPVGDSKPAARRSQLHVNAYAFALSRARLALFAQDMRSFRKYFKAAVERAGVLELDRRLLLDLLPPSIPFRLHGLLQGDLRVAYLEELLEHCLIAPFMPEPALFAWLIEQRDALPPQLRARAAAVLALGTDPSGIESLLEGAQGVAVLETRVLLALREGRWDEARTLAAGARAASRGPSGRRKPQLDGPLAPLLTLVLATGDPEQQATARAQFKRVRNEYKYRYWSLDHLMADPTHASIRLRYLQEHLQLEALLECLAIAWLGAGLSVEAQERAAQYARKAGEHFELCGCPWLAYQAFAVSAHLLQLAGGPGTGPSPTLPLLLVLKRSQAPWENLLDRVESLPLFAKEEAAKKSTARPGEERVVYHLDLQQHTAEGFFYSDDPDDFAYHHGPADGDADKDSDSTYTTLRIAPRLQKRRAKGWTAGRALALRRLATEPERIPALSDHDRRVAQTIESHVQWNRQDFHMGARALLALAGHPHLYWQEDPQGPTVELVAQPPAISVERGPAGFCLRPYPVPSPEGIAVAREGAHRLVVAQFSKAQLSVLSVLYDSPAIPAEGEARLREFLGKLAPHFSVHSELAPEPDDAQVNVVQADSRPLVLLSRAEPGLTARVVAAPFDASAPHFVPGQGPPSVTTELADGPAQCTRDLKAEHKALNAVCTAIAELQGADVRAVSVGELHDCLHLIDQLNALADQVRVQWQDGEPLRLEGQLDTHNLRLRLTERGQWLSVQGEARLNDDLVLSMSQLAAQRTADGAFVDLGDGRFVALAGELRDQLSSLFTAAQPDKKGDALRMPPAALGFVSPWLREIESAGGLKLSAPAAKRLQRIAAAYERTPEPPRTLQAQLRPYQRVGFQFLCRLADFGAGAVLADDMGLGKTLMALCLLLERAQQGPALVVAPVSIRGNWSRESARFAPTLRVLPAGPKGQLPAPPAPYDVVVCSYASLAQHIETYERTHWATVVLDEAQAIKNASTLRAKSARRLVADARVVLSGTPVENHLGDLHGLMSFANPGLLGTGPEFARRFGKPIQRDGDRHAAATLRQLISPFVLRRRKVEVLQELPSRTERVELVEPGEKEQAFSEALRRDALARLKQSAGTPTPVSILAEITRLRRAACHPRLVNEAADVGSAKLDRCVELLHELREGNHRALVFSQFVGFLKLVRERFKQEGISYQYLDGSTSEARRERAVAAFQAGSSDAFLISLKAGGTGLNLTAADYVIHLDPWWNPAVEDQASDRAHRIGQTRPVTICRLVNASSIEQSVLSLHDRKRELAAELLSETDTATRLNAELLMGLLRDD